MRAKMKMLMDQTFLKGIGSTIEIMLKIDQSICSNDTIVVIVFQNIYDEVQKVARIYLKLHQII